MQNTSWSYEFSHPVSEVWKFVANTDRLNHLIGLPPVAYTNETGASGAPERVGEFRRTGITLRWRESPYEWIENQFFRVRRQYLRGPFRSIAIEWKFEETSTGCILRQTFNYEMANRWTKFLGRLLLDIGARKDFLRGYGIIDRHLAKKRSSEVFSPFPQATQTEMPNPKRRAQLKERLLQAKIEESTADRLLGFILESSELDLVRIRPFRVASRLGLSRMNCLLVLLKACQVGVLSLEWSALCPVCRGSKAAGKILGKIKKMAHCSSCNIEFKSEFSKSIELVFSPHESVRKVTEKEFCVGSPRNTPHFYLQQRLMPGERAVFPVKVSAGSYRLRSPQSKQEFMFGVNNEDDLASAETRCVFDQRWKSQVSGETATIALSDGPSEIHVENATSEELTLVFERAEWLEDVCTATLASSLHEFRNVFSSQIFDLEEKVDFSTVAVMFTDLKGSAALYQKIGDAQAFVLIQKHFQIIAECVKAHEGGVVKTIGDSVMAVFSSGENALLAGIEIQKRLAEDAEMQARVAIHQGPCFMIRLNDILDFFGTTVNLASRLQNQCEGGHLAISAQMFDDLGVRKAMKKQRVVAEQDVRNFKGFDCQFEVYKIRFRPVESQGSAA
jgi:class 3 adenylate cyclase